MMSPISEMLQDLFLHVIRSSDEVVENHNLPVPSWILCCVKNFIRIHQMQYIISKFL